MWSSFAESPRTPNCSMEWSRQGWVFLFLCGFVMLSRADPAMEQSAGVERTSPSQMIAKEQQQTDISDQRSASGRDRKLRQRGEDRSIEAIKRPFLQVPGKFRMPGNGISLELQGEPKSGTTWFGRLVPRLALELCGAHNNQWCEMGGLQVKENYPAPGYEFEMLNKTQDGLGGSAPTLFLHFKGMPKHIIPGMDQRQDHDGCHNGGDIHIDNFQDTPPCLSGPPPTRELLNSCIWDSSPACLQYMSSPDPAVRRSIVVFREPRDVIISAYRMRIWMKTGWVLELKLEQYVQRMFENLVAWIHQRYVWHTTSAFAASSHLVYYEDFQDSHLGFIDMAAFMGLQCSPEQALSIYEAHRNPTPHGNYEHHPGLSRETIEWMTGVMARLLPPPLAERWGVTPTDL